MKNAVLFLAILFLMTMPAFAQVDILSEDSSITISCQFYDSSGLVPVEAEANDSVTISTRDVQSGATVGDSLEYTTTDDEVSVDNGELVFHSVFSDINGANGDGCYDVSIRFTDVSLGLSQTKHIYVSAGQYTTLAENIDAMWDELQTAHTTEGTFGYYLDAQVSGIGGGNISTAQRDSLMGYARRAAAALLFPCDSSVVVEYPLHTKPKDSICVFCITDLGGGNADTTKVATFYSTIYGKSTSGVNVMDTISAKKTE